MRHLAPSWAPSWIVLATLLTAAAGPAPDAPGAKPPAKPAKPDPNTTEYVAAPVKARFRVPKLWQRREVPNASPDAVFFFDPAPKKKPGQVTFQQYVSVYLSPAKPTQKTLEDVVGDTRAALQKMTPGVKFTRDRALTYAGRPAWTFHWTAKTKVTSATPDGRTTNSYLDTDRVETVWLERDTVCQVGLIADVRFMPSLMEKAEPVAKSVTWDK
ncbi:MAG TPA: hypothetical protein VF595_14295 [Tepidisphaeraceae bacterium]|jgi:hypothetical protein